MAQLVTRIDDELVAGIDELVRDGVAVSRSDAVRMGLEQLIDRSRRRKIGSQISDAYRRFPQTDAENVGLHQATQALVEEEPW